MQYRSVSELQNTSLKARILKIRFTHMLHPDSKFPKFWSLFREQNFSNILPILTSFKSSGLFYYTALIWPNEYGPGLPRDNFPSKKVRGNTWQKSTYKQNNCFFRLDVNESVH